MDKAIFVLNTGSSSIKFGILIPIREGTHWALHTAARLRETVSKHDLLSSVCVGEVLVRYQWIMENTNLIILQDV